MVLQWLECLPRVQRAQCLIPDVKWIWWYVAVIPALQKWEQEALEFKDTLCYTVNEKGPSCDP